MTVLVKNVPKACADSYNPQTPFVMFGLWEYEHKQTALHFVVQRNTEYDGSVRSKVGLRSRCVGVAFGANHRVYDPGAPHTVRRSAPVYDQPGIQPAYKRWRQRLE